MKKPSIPEHKLLEKLCRLARKRNAAFGLEYFPAERIWRGTIAVEPDRRGCWWTPVGRKRRRREIVLLLLAELASKPAKEEA